MPRRSNWDKKRDDWISLVSNLCSEVKQWSKAKRWTVLEDKKDVTEEHLGTYQLPTLTIVAPKGRIHVDPIGVNVVGADGRIDLLSYPSLNRLLLVRKGADWSLYTDSLVPWPDRWGKDCFAKLVEALTQ